MGYSLKKYFGGKDTVAYKNYKAGQKSGKWVDLPAYIAKGGTGTGEGESYEDIVAKQKTTEDEYLGRYTTAIGALPKVQDIFERLSKEKGLEQATNVSRGLQSSFEAIPEQEKIAGKQFGISAPRLAKRVVERQSTLAPQVTKAGTQEANIRSDIAGQISRETAESERTLLPYQTEAAFISDRVAALMTGWTAERAASLQTGLQMMANENAMDIAKLNNIAALAKQEDAYARELENAKNLQEWQSRLNSPWG